MKPGDMVVLVKIEKGSQAYEWGARLGHIGTIVMVGGLIAENGQYYDCAVRFDSIRDPRCLAACFYSSLRQIGRASCRERVLRLV